MEPLIIYKKRLQQLLQQQKKFQQKKTIFGILRFGTVALLIGLFYFLWAIGPLYVAIAAIILFITFVKLVYRDIDNRAALLHVNHMILINEAELKAVEGDFYQFGCGNEHIPKDHYYANDLDIFGHASLFQLLNRTTSEMGSHQLASWLTDPASTEEIPKRQEAIRELKEKLLWRQELQAYGRETIIRQTTLSRLRSWLNEPPVFIHFKPWQWLRYVLPAIILSVVILAIFKLIHLNLLYLFLLLYAIIAFQINKLIAPLHEKLSKMVDELDILSQSINLVEKEIFHTDLLSVLKENFVSSQRPASKNIGQIKKILDRLDIRYNIVLSAPLNLLLLWNLQQVLDLEKWKKKHIPDVDKWFQTLGIFEALSSLATLHFNNPGWIFPSINQEHFFIEASGLGHPLINKSKRINNYIGIQQSGYIMLVTGSNMAGKSTYLRSVGINVVLAMAGAPVCATAFVFSPVQLLTSMRIADNLEESTSTFYAELKKLKHIIEKVNNGEKVFVLLDEILRGTNSLDRHTGSVALIKQLIRHKASAIIATHDLGLADLQKIFPENILNFHFDVQVKQDELFFDYELKPGVCTSMNASILMKKIGIEL